MKTMSARGAKNSFGLMIDIARATPVLIEKHGRGVVVVISVGEYEKLSVQSGHADKGEWGLRGASQGGLSSVHARRDRPASERRRTAADRWPHLTLRPSARLR
ncbi:MAG: type II toxin-antitoxin system prevent-host-death family antitoxin [Mesorhizobium sp.]|nr:type II toxin-antitoxin system prevent-host-death family antitoxin [Mesorhizobium sp.]